MTKTKFVRDKIGTKKEEKKDKSVACGISQKRSFRSKRIFDKEEKLQLNREEKRVILKKCDIYIVEKQEKIHFSIE